MSQSGILLPPRDKKLQEQGTGRRRRFGPPEDFRISSLSDLSFFSSPAVINRTHSSAKKSTDTHSAKKSTCSIRNGRRDSPGSWIVSRRGKTSRAKRRTNNRLPAHQDVKSPEWRRDSSDSLTRFLRVKSRGKEAACQLRALGVELVCPKFGRGHKTDKRPRQRRRTSSHPEFQHRQDLSRLLRVSDDS